MANLIALKPLADNAEPKTARQGTRMVRRADVMHGLNKLIHYARRNLHVAEEEGRWKDADVQRARLRAFDLMRDVMATIPIFENPQDTPASVDRSPKGGDANAAPSRSDESAVGSEADETPNTDRSNP